MQPGQADWKRTVGILLVPDNPQLPSFPHGEIYELSRNEMFPFKVGGSRGHETLEREMPAHTSATGQGILSGEKTRQGVYMCRGYAVWYFQSDLKLRNIMSI